MSGTPVRTPRRPPCIRYARVTCSSLPDCWHHRHRHRGLGREPHRRTIHVFHATAARTHARTPKPPSCVRTAELYSRAHIAVRPQSPCVLLITYDSIHIVHAHAHAHASASTSTPVVGSVQAIHSRWQYRAAEPALAQTPTHP